MVRLFLALILLAAPATAAERRLTLVSFDRIRVDGPYAVTVTTRATPLARISGGARALDTVDVRVEGGTLIVRPGLITRRERPRTSDAAPPVVEVQTRDLRSLAIVGDGRLTVAGPVTASRVDVTATGGGQLIVPAIDADDLTVTLIGIGRITLAGAARRARLVGSGGGAIAAEGLAVGDLTIRSEGVTEVAATARYTATATSTGPGAITITGKPDCRIRALGGGTITCFNAVKPTR